MTLPTSTRARIAVLLSIPVLLYLLLFTYRIVRWEMWIWLPTMVTSGGPSEQVADADKHLVFVICDHYEPGSGPAGTERNRRWLDGYKPIADRHFDSAGNRVRYTWFYPFEHGNDEVLVELNRMAYEDYGEVELHWHHPTFTNETFPDSLDAALDWFRSYGTLISSGPEPETNFAFIHGNWALDGSKDFCGVTLELDILQSRGCYGDFTFSTIGTTCQPRSVNRIYYAEDGPEPKSYEDGVDAEVGRSNPPGFMIFLGPLDFDWLRVRPEYGAIGEAEPTELQINQWIDANIHVQGRPEWVFVKVYAHGIQTRTIASGAMAGTLEFLEAVCRQRGITLHYMTSREAFNLVKAAEDGHDGDPEQYRDYRIPPPANRYFHTEVPVQVERVTATEAIYSVID